MINLLMESLSLESMRQLIKVLNTEVAGNGYLKYLDIVKKKQKELEKYEDTTIRNK